MEMSEDQQSYWQQVRGSTATSGAPRGQSSPARKQLRFWSRAITAIGYFYLVFGSIGALIIAFHTEKSYYSNGWEIANETKPYLGLGWGLFLANLLFSAVVITLGNYVRWRTEDVQ